VLVLTRKVGDVIAIGDNIKIVVMAIKGKQVRLGVQADRNTVVHREEIYQKIQQETRAALQNDMTSARAAGDLLRGSTEGQGQEPDTPPRKSSGFIVRKASTQLSPASGAPSAPSRGAHGSHDDDDDIAEDDVATEVDDDLDESQANSAAPDSTSSKSPGNKRQTSTAPSSKPPPPKRKA